MTYFSPFRSNTFSRDFCSSGIPGIRNEEIQEKKRCFPGASHISGMGLQIIYTYIYIWVNYNDLTATSLEVMGNKGNHPQMALINLNYTLPIYIYMYMSI